MSSQKAVRTHCYPAPAIENGAGDTAATVRTFRKRFVAEARAACTEAL